MRSGLVHLAGRLFFWVGLLTLTFAGGVWAYAGIYQRYQSWRFEKAMAAPEQPTDLHEGDLVGKLEIPRIGISVIVLQGTEDETLAVGAGHVPGTPLPGAPGNVAIAAHRDTFFRGLKGIRAGDSILFSNAQQTFEYVVDSMETVDPDDTHVIESQSRPELTLITCFPFYFIGSAPKRFVVHARPLNAPR